MQLVITGVVEVIIIPIIMLVINHIVGKRLDHFDEKREDARAAQAEAERKAIEQREAERVIILAMSRTMLLNNWERCMAKGFYTLEEREVYHKLYEAYHSDGGNSVIDELAPRIRALPMEPPNNK
jgi:hypothetical protein